ncbi:1-(5-phosphoribosyl)-5-[(5-phosphoribosylamino)methylideneamino]imidazole-4-carboxamide isomerase [Salisaeta longa]|uniref:1-(5-phosphoribosyl)-5-[(5- phosphoribosylamino)methylideneamino]imidazole-4- carboxamide isomerase n=1 Tax=Salisaeta longa TaxID=503170 RepID=UPI0003B485E6|nr:1-(5-phosphoribosyl)-5-[(5-phosphoribosylamino)methylideneamino]imidazole-4-carboxamide isomerase [Salisaeta longa]
MTTLVIPAIDLRGGRCVRLHQGSYEQETVYFDDPVKMAKLWRVQNARTLHIVDLDAARGGSEDRADNRAVIRKMCDALDIPVQLGGGIRSLDDIEAALEMGVYRVIIGTAAVRDPDMVEEAVARFGCRRIVVGIDARDGEARVQGWTEGSGVDAVDLALDMERRGVRRIVYTDISRDGTLEGPNIDAYRVMGKHLTDMRITASGGVGAYKDLLAIQTLTPYGVDSVITGTALYENRFPCQQFWSWNDKDAVDLDTFSTAPLRDDALKPC